MSGVTRIGRFEVSARLGAGGMGEVFLARAPGDAASVVVKRVLPHLARDEGFRALFLDEASISARLVHPHIARILELGEDGGLPFLVMEYVPGVDVRRLTREANAPVPFGVAARIVADAAGALHFAHTAVDARGQALRVVHRDVSPHNLLVGRGGVVKLIDFGVARAVRQDSDAAAGAGKYGYLAPEVLEGAEATPLSDEFSLGVVFWELLTGVRLFEADTDVETMQRVLECRVEGPGQVRPGVPDALATVALRMLAKAPTERFPNLGEVREALEVALREPGLDGGRAALAAWAETVLPADVEVAPSGDVEAEALAEGFVGRVAELSALGALVGRAPLVAVTGRAGIGKTRLVLEFAKRSGRRVIFGAWEASTDVARLLEAGPAASVGPGEAVLLVVDGVGRLGAEAVTRLREWLAVRPLARVVVTARAVDGVPEDACFEVPPLLEAASLLRVFLGGRLAGGEAGDAFEVVLRRLGGVPLDIELVAANVGGMTLAQLADALAVRGGALALACDGLSLAEVSTLAQLSVFPGAFSLEAAEAVVDLSAVSGAPWVMDAVEALVARRLVRAEEGGGDGALRFWLPGGVRDEAAARLASTVDGGAAVRARHASFLAGAES